MPVGVERVCHRAEAGRHEDDFGKGGFPEERDEGFSDRERGGDVGVEDRRASRMGLPPPVAMAALLKRTSI